MNSNKSYLKNYIILGLILFGISTVQSQTHEGKSKAKPIKLRKAPTFPPSIKAEIEFWEPSGNGILDAEEEGYISVTLSNTGRGKVVALKMEIKPSRTNQIIYLPNKNIGDIAPGSKKNIRIPITAGFDVESVTRNFTLSFREANGFEPPPVKLTFNTRKFIPPELEVVKGVGLNDANNNGMIEPGEVVEITARIQNIGVGVAKNVKAKVNLGDNVFFAGETETDFSLGKLSPGQHHDITFSIYTNFRATEIPVFVDITEFYLKFGKSNIHIPLTLNKPLRQLTEIVVKGTETEAVGIVMAGGPGVDVDIDIPKTNMKNPDAVAVVIGISRYQNRDVPNVDYARRDATIMKEYLINTLGYDPRRIIEIYDEQASLSGFKKIFEEQLHNYIRNDKSDVFVYYSGHGAPDPESKEAFFVPYDCDPSYAKSTGYKVKEFYKNLSELKARSVTVVIDACFSGSSDAGMLLKGISPIFIKVDNPVAALHNGIVFTSATGQQVSSWYHEKKHSLFTYYFLKGMQGDADLNKDKKLTALELAKYIESNVPDQARYLNNREQTPQLKGKNKETVLIKYK